MARTQSLNYHLEIASNKLIHPKSIGEFGPGEEGRIEVADGTRKYRIRDNIWDIGEIEVEIYLPRNWADDGSEFQEMEAWCNSNEVRDIYIIGTDIVGATNHHIAWLCRACELAKGKKNAFDRNSKEADTVKYYILPTEVVLVDSPNPEPSTGVKDFSTIWNK